MTVLAFNMDKEVSPRSTSVSEVQLLSEEMFTEYLLCARLIQALGMP